MKLIRLIVFANIFLLLASCTDGGLKEDSLVGEAYLAKLGTLSPHKSVQVKSSPSKPRDWGNTEWDSILEQQIEVNGLADITPEDFKDYSGYNDALLLPYSKIVSFWRAFFIELAAEESSFRPTLTYKENFKNSQGDLVVSSGLFQLSLESVQAKVYKCDIKSQDDLLDPEKNIRCAVNIVSYLVKRDNAISLVRNGKYRGAAAYFGTLRLAKKIEKIKNNIRKAIGTRTVLGDGAEGGGAN